MRFYDVDWEKKVLSLGVPKPLLDNMGLKTHQLRTLYSNLLPIKNLSQNHRLEISSLWQIKALCNDLQPSSFNAISPAQYFTVIFCAALAGNLEFIQYVYSKKPQLLNFKSLSNQTLVHFAALGGHTKILTWILEKEKEALSSKDDNQYSLVHYAVFSNKLNVLIWAQENELSLLTGKDLSGRYIAHYAVIYKQMELIKWINKYHPEQLNMKDKNQQTIEFYAAESGDCDFFNEVLSMKKNPFDADLNSPNFSNIKQMFETVINALSLNSKIASVHLPSKLMPPYHETDLKLLSEKTDKINEKILENRNISNAKMEFTFFVRKFFQDQDPAKSLPLEIYYKIFHSRLATMPEPIIWKLFNDIMKDQCPTASSEFEATVDSASNVYSKLS